MSVVATCSCGYTINAPDRFAGHRVKCPACHAPVELQVGDAFDALVDSLATSPAKAPSRDSNRELADFTEAIVHELRRNREQAVIAERYVRRISFWVVFWSIAALITPLLWLAVLTILTTA